MAVLINGACASRNVLAGESPPVTTEALKPLTLIIWTEIESWQRERDDDATLCEMYKTSGYKQQLTVAADRSTIAWQSLRKGSPRTFLVAHGKHLFASVLPDWSLLVRFTSIPQDLAWIPACFFGLFLSSSSVSSSSLSSSLYQTCFGRLGHGNGGEIPREQLPRN